MIVVTPDISVLYQMLNFIILLFVLNWVLYRPVRRILLERKEKMVDLEGLASKAQEDLLEQKNTYKDGIKAAQMQGRKEKEGMLDAVAKEEKEILEQIGKKAAADLAEIKEQVAKQKSMAKTSLEAEMEGLAKAIAENIMGRPCS